MCCGADRPCSFLSWKALKINNDWPDSVLSPPSPASQHSPAHKPLNYIPNIPSAGLLNVSVVSKKKKKICEMLRVLDKEAPNN